MGPSLACRTEREGRAGGEGNEVSAKKRYVAKMDSNLYVRVDSPFVLFIKKRARVGVCTYIKARRHTHSRLHAQIHAQIKLTYEDT